MLFTSETSAGFTPSEALWVKRRRSHQFAPTISKQINPGLIRFLVEHTTKEAEESAALRAAQQAVAENKDIADHAYRIRCFMAVTHLARDWFKDPELSRLHPISLTDIPEQEFKNLHRQATIINYIEGRTFISPPPFIGEATGIIDILSKSGQLPDQFAGASDLLHNPAAVSKMLGMISDIQFMELQVAAGMIATLDQHFGPIN